MTEEKSTRLWIVEDNLSFALEMEIFATDLGYEVLGMTSKAEDALEQIPAHEPDLIIMDINLEGEMNGLELAEKLEPTGIPILFITVHDRPDYFELAKTTNWAGYLVKPFDKLSLQAAIEMALRSPHSAGKEEDLEENILRPDCLLIKAQGVYHRVLFSNIDFIQSEGNYCTLFTKERKYAIKISLRQLLEGLPKDQFCQIHKSHAVQLSRIDAIDSVAAEVVIGSHRLPLGKGFRDSLIRRFKVLK
ncbi:MAG: response regulator [Lewinellaceae bacterium]|nr:response regulator [Lewinellaceae bacterium]